MEFVYAFDEQAPGGRELLGGKGIGLAEMTALGVPVPAGFTVTTDACREVMRSGDVPDDLWRQVETHIARLEETSGKRFGDPQDPLLVSVRSGAAVSMPGMMDTILNLGLDDVAVEGLAAATGNPRFAFDSYRRLIQMYGEVVDGIDAHLFEEELQYLKERRGVQLDVELDADDLRALIGTFQGIYEREVRTPFPADASEQLRRAVRAVFDSWESPRAKVYRRTYDIPDDLGTAVNVVQMVFGNKGDSSGTGVCFTRDPRPASGDCSASSSSTPRARTSSRESARPSRSRGCSTASPSHTGSWWRPSTASRRTTARCRTWSSPSRRGRSSCCRRAQASGRRAPRCGSQSR